MASDAHLNAEAEISPSTDGKPDGVCPLATLRLVKSMY